jgi:hypothetical protein
MQPSCLGDERGWGGTDLVAGLGTYFELLCRSVTRTCKMPKNTEDSKDNVATPKEARVTQSKDPPAAP